MPGADLRLISPRFYWPFLPIAASFFSLYNQSVPPVPKLIGRREQEIAKMALKFETVPAGLEVAPDRRYAIANVRRVWYVVDIATGVRASSGTYSREQAVAQALSLEAEAAKASSQAPVLEAPKASQAERRQALTAAGIIIRKTEENEYRVNYRGASERYAAYETDILAAIETGEAMNRSRPEVIKADIRKAAR
jgi:hypothetical protein